MEQFDFAGLGLLLFIACLTAMITRRLHLPYSVGLVAAGIALALAPFGYSPVLTPHLIFTVLLPPLIFDAAIQIPWKPFRNELPLLAALVTLGVVLGAAVVAAGMHFVAGWGWLGASFLGVLLAATDPVSVIAMFKEVKVDHRLHLLVEAESLLNDGVAAVGFSVLVMFAGGVDAGAGMIGWKLIETAFGGIMCGIVITLPLLLVAGRTDDNLVEVTLTTLAAFGSFLMAEHFGMSGVLAALAAGVMVGNVGWMGSISDRGRQSVVNFWEYMAFLANSVVFILIGGSETKIHIAPVLVAICVATILSLIGRAASVYPVALLFRRSRLCVPTSFQHVLWWGGLRGALALALALAVPASVPERGQIITVAFAVVAFSIFAQGLTMSSLVKWLGLKRPPEPEGEGQPA